jgi:hypothetical protein
MLSVVPANAGTYTAESIVFTRSRTFLRTQGLPVVMDPRFRGDDTEYEVRNLG